MIFQLVKKCPAVRAHPVRLEDRILAAHMTPEILRVPTWLRAALLCRLPMRRRHDRRSHWWPWVNRAAPSVLAVTSLLLVLSMLVDRSSAFLWPTGSSRAAHEGARLIRSRPIPASRLFSHGEDAAAFARVVRARYSNKRYRPEPIPDHVLAELLTLSQRAPSSFNVQPYTCVVVRGEEAKQRLAGAMLGSNGQSVLEAPVTLVLAADLESGGLLPKVLELHRRAKAFPEEFLKKMPFYAMLFSGGHRTWLLRWLVHAAKRLLLALLGLFQPVPRFDHPQAWAFKNAALVAQTLMLAATAHGLTSCPMEGFDACRVRRALGLPRRYGIPMVLTLGYPRLQEDDRAGARTVHSERFPPQDVFYWDRFGAELPPGLIVAAAAATQ